jgi:uncharacterized protein YukE
LKANDEEVNMRILVTPERLDDLSRQMTQAANELRDLEGRLGRALGSLDWEARQQANVEARVNAARRQAQNLAGEAEELARFLTDRAAAFRQADAQGAESLGATTQAYLRAVTPIPIPTPVPATKSGFSIPSLPDAIKALDDVLKPIDWISNSKRASRAFDRVLEDIGRLLNALTGQRGHIKMMNQFGDFLKGSSQGMGFLSNLLDARQMQQYFSGQLTNAQIAETAIKALVPIPILNDRLAQWLVQNMPDPHGHWHGLAAPVE